MPSLLQARQEALAARVEAARRSPIVTVARFLWDIPFDPVPARIERIDGSSIELQLEEVQLDPGELRGRGPKNRPLAMPLDDVKAVWFRRVRPRRAAGVYLSILAACELWLLPNMARIDQSWLVMLVIPLLLAGPLCAGAWIVLKRLKPFQEWVPVFDRADAP